ncbi:t-SNARE [Conidiobolus coronatus NRRL 28638]|uniref:t-SNARE n=1 Tax=Conidiobolus coronatus (strain ATCC 28846 / CBS 209.66 / NRRL 28638) TaxID=796925 RepID=A0A137P9X2_CONC2|nr:t-SNARE [Conidiobolus coronatus NRRL 28638]|eukprot:KXN71800.1 t-SNARE [Conidiobolus coronatus NRRL 28638]
MSRDRLAELRTNNSYHQDLEMGTMPASYEPNGYLKEVSATKTEIETFNAMIRKISSLHEQSLNSVGESQLQESNAQMEELTGEAKGLMQNIKGRLKVLQVMKVKDQSELKILQSQYSTLKKQFMESIADYQKVEKQYRTKYKERMERQYRIVRPDATEDEVAEALDDELIRPIFAQSVLNQARVGEAKQALKEVQDRHLDIQKIVKSIEELNQLYTEMQYMVEQQDILVDNIETHIETANAALEQTNVHLNTATTTARATRKKKWFLLAIAIVLIIIIALIIYFSVRKT